MNPVRIRRLNETGLARMEDFLDSFAQQPDRSVDFQRDLWPILTGVDTTSHVPNVVQADADRRFPRRFDLAEYLYGLIPNLGLQDPTRDRGLWAWLSLLWFEQLAPVTQRGRRVGERARWLPLIGNGRRYYRHFVLGPYMIYAAHSDAPLRAEVLLSEPPFVTTSEIYREFVESPLVACKPVIEAVRTIYWEPAAGRLKRGVGVKGAGGSRRLVEVLMQFDRTVDLYMIDVDVLLRLLPSEFDRFIGNTPRQPIMLGLAR